jgi:3-methyladenine DNA glycosylase AlkD
MAGARLRAAADPKAARRALSYFKGGQSIRVHGVPTPLARRIERDLFGMVRGAWTVNEALRFCDLMVRRPFQEGKEVGFRMLHRFREQFDAGLIVEAEGWIAGGFCSNWTAVDSLCPAVITPLARRHPALLDRVMTWSGSPNMWLRRASAVTFVPLARKGEFLGLAYRTAASLLADDEDLIHKAVGWMLREAGRTDAPRLEAFLLRHGPRIPRTTLRYAIERFPQRRRRALLTATR